MSAVLLYEFTKIFMLFVTASSFLYLHADMSVVPETVDQMYSLIQTDTKTFLVQQNFVN
jgi:hypothetical protein